MSLSCSAVSPGESLATVGADVGFLHTALVGAHMVAHAVLPLEALLADGTRERLLVRVGQAVAVQMVNITESLAAGLAGVVLPHRVGVGIRGPLREKTQTDKHTPEFRPEVFFTQIAILTVSAICVCFAYANVHRYYCPVQTILRAVLHVRLISSHFWSLSVLT